MRRCTRKKHIKFEKTPEQKKEEALSWIALIVSALALIPGVIQLIDIMQKVNG